MTAAVTATWHGRRGSVILGPTEARVARFLDHATRSGRVSIRTVDLASHLQLERSEAYRITRRLRILGLFGIENDKGGSRGGRRYWRTPIEHDGVELDQTRHRNAWARVVSWATARRARLHARLALIREGRRWAGTPARDSSPAPTSPLVGAGDPSGRSAESGDGTDGDPGAPHAERPGLSVADLLRKYGAGGLLDEWGVE